MAGCGMGMFDFGECDCPQLAGNVFDIYGRYPWYGIVPFSHPVADPLVPAGLVRSPSIFPPDANTRPAAPVNAQPIGLLYNSYHAKRWVAPSDLTNKPLWSNNDFLSKNQHTHTTTRPGFQGSIIGGTRVASDSSETVWAVEWRSNQHSTLNPTSPLYVVKYDASGAEPKEVFAVNVPNNFAIPRMTCAPLGGTEPSGSAQAAWTSVNSNEYAVLRGPAGGSGIVTQNGFVPQGSSAAEYTYSETSPTRTYSETITHISMRDWPMGAGSSIETLRSGGLPQTANRKIYHGPLTYVGGRYRILSKNIISDLTGSGHTQGFGGTAEIGDIFRYNSIQAFESSGGTTACLYTEGVQTITGINPNVGFFSETDTTQYLNGNVFATRTTSPNAGGIAGAATFHITHGQPKLVFAPVGDGISPVQSFGPTAVYSLSGGKLFDVAPNCRCYMSSDRWIYFVGGDAVNNQFPNQLRQKIQSGGTFSACAVRHDGSQSIPLGSLGVGANVGKIVDWPGPWWVTAHLLGDAIVGGFSTVPQITQYHDCVKNSEAAQFSPPEDGEEWLRLAAESVVQ